VLCCGEGTRAHHVVRNCLCVLVNVIIIGGGLIGVTTAYFLRKHGHEVTVLDRQDGPAQETSFANGSLLTPSMPEPWNAPGCWRVLLNSLGRSDAPLQLRIEALPSLAGWGIDFLRNSRPARFKRSTIRNLNLALYSLKAMETLRRETRIEYGRGTRGTLRVFRDSAGMNRALMAADCLATEGLMFRHLSTQELVDLEPALSPIRDQLVGAIHYSSDESGDAHWFCVALLEYLRKQGVKFAGRTVASRFEVKSRSVTGVRTNDGNLSADQYVVSAGSYSGQLLRPLGLRLPVKPAKGYSVTFDPPVAGGTLSIPVVDDDVHAAVVPLGTSIRVAGTAEFAGFDLRLRPKRIANLVGLAQKILPHAGFEPTKARAWCGLRPMSADGVPLIGRTTIRNLWVSSGHGHLGWTLAAGSAQLLADLISGEPPSIDPAPYDLGRSS
jgi:D-amino-acid dehydrogenase